MTKTCGTRNHRGLRTACFSKKAFRFECVKSDDSMQHSVRDSTSTHNINIRRKRRNRISFCLLLQLIPMSVHLFRRQIIHFCFYSSLLARAYFTFNCNCVSSWWTGVHIFNVPTLLKSRFLYSILWCLLLLLLFAWSGVWLARQCLARFGAQLIASWTRQMKGEDLSLLFSIEM